VGARKRAAGEKFHKIQAGGRRDIPAKKRATPLGRRGLKKTINPKKKDCNRLRKAKRKKTSKIVSDWAYQEEYHTQKNEERKPWRSHVKDGHEGGFSLRGAGLKGGTITEGENLEVHPGLRHSFGGWGRPNQQRMIIPLERG